MAKKTKQKTGIKRAINTESAWKQKSFPTVQGSPHLGRFQDSQGLIHSQLIWNKTDRLEYHRGDWTASSLAVHVSKDVNQLSNLKKINDRTDVGSGYNGGKNFIILWNSQDI